MSERFITYFLPDLHVLVSTRYPLPGQALTAWRAKGEVLDLTRDDFVFQSTEIELLFQDTYGMQLTPDDVATLAHKTEGWPIALQLVWQGLRHNPALRVPDLLMASPGEGSLGALFDYLADGVRQPLARVWEDPVANPNAGEQDRPVKRARSTSRTVTR